MFESLSERLGTIFDRLGTRAHLDEAQVDAALTEIRTALLEADVALRVVDDFLQEIRPRAIGADVMRAVRPSQQVVKIVHDGLIDMLGAAAPLSFNAPAPVAMMLVGLQGSGKTTSAAKLAHHISKQEKKKVLLASLDTYRPAAQEQLKTLAEKIDIAMLPIIADETPAAIAHRAQDAARLGGYDVLLFDTAGRTQADVALMEEMQALAKQISPHETLLVADSLMGQSAIEVARAFGARVALTGLILTRSDGDGRGGAALSMRSAAGVPIKFLGVGETPDSLEVFDAKRVAGRILGMGDVVGLVERASDVISEEQAAKQAEKLKRGIFTMQDLAEQLRAMQKMGGLSALMNMMPMIPGLGGMNKMKKQLDPKALGFDNKAISHQCAIVSSMTEKERNNPALLNASRKKRIAAGSGTSVPQINKLIKMHRQMASMMKKLGKLPNADNLLNAGGQTSANDIGALLGGDMGQNPFGKNRF